MSVGVIVGFVDKLGIEVVGDADTLGFNVGSSVGVTVGEVVGDFVGAFVVGDVVGDFVGAFVGDVVGAFVGAFVVGDLEGEAVGATVGSPDTRFSTKWMKINVACNFIIDVLESLRYYLSIKQNNFVSFFFVLALFCFLVSAGKRAVDQSQSAPSPIQKYLVHELCTFYVQ